jgi:hypothetical protein
VPAGTASSTSQPCASVRSSPAPRCSRNSKNHVVMASGVVPSLSRQRIFTWLAPNAITRSIFAPGGSSDQSLIRTGT